jgi:formate dehydrogenase subunit delta
MTDMTTDDKLIHMANQIADFFAAQGEARAVPGIANHIDQFWSPQMRRDFLALATREGVVLKPFVRLALPLIAAATTSPA